MVAKKEVRQMVHKETFDLSMYDVFMKESKNGRLYETRTCEEAAEYIKNLPNLFKVNEAKGETYSFEVDHSHDFTYCSFQVFRPETDAELKKRLDREEKQRQKSKAAKEKQKQLKAQKIEEALLAERAEYERLAKKFGKKGHFQDGHSL